jgi:hypothetical protein
VFYRALSRVERLVVNYVNSFVYNFKLALIAYLSYRRCVVFTPPRQ